MKNRTKLIGLIALLFIAAAFLLWPSNRDKTLKEKGKATSQSPNAPSIPVVVPPTKGGAASPSNPMQALMQTPIDFYGIVLDQDGNPVPSAKVSATVLDNMMKGSPLSTSSDAKGKFGIKSRGLSLHIEVSKPGYCFVEMGGILKPSSQGFDFGVDNGKGIYQTDQASPSIFHLRKAGNAIALDRLTANPKVPRDGTPVTVYPSRTSTVGLQILCRTNEDNQVPNAPYDWRCEIKVDGGGIQEMAGEHIFVAPDGGYSPSAVIDMPKTLDSKQWNSRASRSYWLRFSDNTFGKINFMMNARGDHFAVINGFRNPSPNDRNLEPKLDAR